MIPARVKAPLTSTVCQQIACSNRSGCRRSCPPTSSIRQFSVSRISSSAPAACRNSPAFLMGTDFHHGIIFFGEIALSIRTNLSADADLALKSHFRSK
jgi:hypothetical protein